SSGQMSFFTALAESAPAQAGGAGRAEAPAVTLPKVPPWPTAEQLKHEKEVLGFYVSSHPLDQHRDTLARFTSCSLAVAKQLAADVQVVVAGMLTRVRPTFTRAKQQKMAMITIEDATGSIDAVVFPDAYALAASLLEQD